MPGSHGAAAIGKAAAATAGASAGAVVAGPVGALVGGTLGLVVGGAAAILHHVLEKDNSSSSDSTDFTRYGDIMKVETTGASWQTSQQDKLGNKGVEASETMAKKDAKYMDDYRSEINRVGRKWEIDPALIAAIISRESRAGKTLVNGKGDGGKAWGLMQVDVDPKGGNHKKRGAWDSEEHLNQATEILVDFIEQIQKKFPGWTREQALKGGIAAYNKGPGSVHSYENVDAITTGKDYSNDVVARAQWYKNNRNY